MEAEAEKESRSRFAQRAIKPEEVARELKETDAILGDPGSVRRFLQEASQRLGFTLTQKSEEIWEMDPALLPEPVRYRLGEVPNPWKITFVSPTPEGAAYIGRNHELIEALAEYLMDQGLHPVSATPPVSRCGVIRTSQVESRTTLLLLRPRYLIRERKKEAPPALMEETLVWGFTGIYPDITPLSPETARHLLDTLGSTANLSPQEKREVLEETLKAWQPLQARLEGLIRERSRHLEETHRRIRQLTKEKSVKPEPSLPPDLLGLLVALPMPKGMRS